MRIISKFKDYYDGMQRLDEERDSVWVRNTEVLKKDDPRFFTLLKAFGSSKNNLLRIPSIYYGRYYSSWDAYQIFFCGKLYMFFYIDGVALYSVDDAIDFLEKKDKDFIPTVGRTNIYKVALEKLREKSRWNLKGFADSLKREWDNCFELASSKLNNVELRKEIGECVLLYNSSLGQITINPNLSEYKFASVVPIDQAYQQISVYLSNDLADNDMTEPRPITDKERAETKGFDDWSFKTLPTENKKFKRSRR